MNKRIVILISFLLVSIVVKSQETGAWSSLDSSAIMIGDQIKYNIGISVPENTQVYWPLITDTITRNIEVLDRTTIDTIYEDDQLNLTQSFLITSFDSGYFELPEVDFQFKLDADTTIYSTSTGILFLQVFVPEVDTSQAFKPIVAPISEPYTLAEILPWIIVITAGLILIGIIIWLFVKRQKKQPVFKRKPAPSLPPDVEALNKFEELRHAKVWQSGQIKKYFTELTDITRVYLERRYHFDAMEMTSDEIISTLNNKSVNAEAKSKLENVLRLADMVKFAKAQPTPLENDLGLTHCVDFVNETKEIPVENLEVKSDLNKEENNG